MHPLITLLVTMLAVVSCGAEIWHAEVRAIGSGPWGTCQRGHTAMWHPQLLGRDLVGTHVMHNLTSEPHEALHQEDLMCGCNLAQPSPTAGETPHGCICVYCPQEGCALCFGGLTPLPHPRRIAMIDIGPIHRPIQASIQNPFGVAQVDAPASLSNAVSTCLLSSSCQWGAKYSSRFQC